MTLLAHQLVLARNVMGGEARKHCATRINNRQAIFSHFSKHFKMPFLLIIPAQALKSEEVMRAVAERR
jgi:hypothetical protein